MAELKMGYKCLQMMLVLMNIVAIVCGIALIAAGAVSEISFKTYGGMVDLYLRAFVWAVIVLGGLITITGIVGFIGACKKNVCCLTMYIIFLSLLVLAGVAAGIAGIVFKDKTKEVASRILNDVFNRYGDPYYKRIADLIQSQLKCCGPNGVWPTIGISQIVPASCFGPDGTQYMMGCEQALYDSLKKHILAVALCALVFALVQIIGIVFAIYVCRAIQQDDDE